MRIIVPFPPGGATDVLGRVLAAGLQTLWGQTVISEYRPGAAGVIGTRQVVAAPRRRPYAADGLDRRDPGARGQGRAVHST